MVEPWTDSLGRLDILTGANGGRFVYEGGEISALAYTYDNLNRLTSASIPARGIVNGQAWDALSRLTGESGLLGTTSYLYDAGGRRTQMTWPDGFAVTYDWDAADRMTALGRSGAPIVQYSYDSLGRRSSITRGNLVNTHYQYDGIGRLTSLAHTGADTAYNVAWSYGYNPAGQITTRTTSNAAYDWNPPAQVTTSLNDRRQPADGQHHGWDPGLRRPGPSGRADGRQRRAVRLRGRRDQRARRKHRHHRQPLHPRAGGGRDRGQLYGRGLPRLLLAAG